jgi:hypothetical protein
MKLSEICNQVANTLPDNLRENLATIKIDGFAIGLKKRKWSFFNGHHQVFVLGGDSNYTTLFGVNKKYNGEISSVADKLGINYVDIGSIPRLSFFSFGEKIMAGGMTGDYFAKFRQYITKYREEVD